LIDILDVSGKILKSVTVGDFTGKNPTSGIKLVGAKSQAQQQRAEILHEISLPAGRIILSTKILATGTGKTQGNPAQLFISFCVTSVTAQNLALNVNLPLEGTVEGKANGAVVSAKNSPASIGISIVGKSEKIEVVKNVLVAKSAVTAVSKETPVLWLVVDGSTNAAAVAAKNEVSASMGKMTNSASEPLLSIVNTLDKENAQPADTIAYTLFCKNVGGAQATDVVVSNPIPAGARFLENSATGEKTDITIVRTATAAPQLGEVKEVRWKFLEPLGAGCEKIVTFKVVIL
ncbi:MAG: DUF11 domain-containing protein, partial [Ignavibacteriales bacterium]|nr:DUF11 domain-containing protein [Ignavibacteriales bacterium]